MESCEVGEIGILERDSIRFGATARHTDGAPERAMG